MIYRDVFLSNQIYSGADIIKTKRSQKPFIRNGKQKERLSEPKVGAGLLSSLLSTKEPARVNKLKPTPNLVHIRFLIDISPITVSCSLGSERSMSIVRCKYMQNDLCTQIVLHKIFN